MHFFKDRIYRTYMTDEMDEHEFIKRLEVAFEQEAKLYPEKKDIIYEGKDTDLIQLVCEEYLSTIQFKKDIAAIKGIGKEHTIDDSMTAETEEEIAEEEASFTEETEELPIDDNEKSHTLTAEEKAKITKKKALKNRQEAFFENNQQQNQYQAIYEQMLLAHRMRQEKMRSYEKINKDGHFYFDPNKLVETKKKAPILEDVSLDRKKKDTFTKNKTSSRPVNCATISFANKDTSVGKSNRTNDVDTYVRYKRLNQTKGIRQEKEKDAWIKTNIENKSKNLKFKDTKEPSHSDLETSHIKTSPINMHKTEYITQRSASKLTERLHTFKERAKSTHQMADRVLSGLGYTNFSYRITYAARHYLTSQMRSGDETRDIVTLTDSVSSISRISYSMICSVSFGSSYKKMLIDKSIQELTAPRLALLKQTLKQKKEAILKDIRNREVKAHTHLKMDLTINKGLSLGILRKELKTAKAAYFEDKFNIVHPAYVQVKKAMKSRAAFSALLSEFCIKGQDIPALKKELKILTIKRRKGLLSGEEVERLSKIKATILLKKAYTAKQNYKLRPRSLLYSIMSLSRRTLSRSPEAGIEGLLKMVDIGTNIYLYKTIKAFYKAGIFFTKKTAKAGKYLGKQYLTKTTSGKVVTSTVKKVSDRIITLKKRAIALPKQTIKTAAATKGGLLTKRGVETTIKTAKMTVLGTKRALTIPRKFINFVTFIPRKLVFLFQAVSTVFSKILLYVGAAFLGFLLVCVLIEFLSSSLFLILGEDEKDGKIDLTPYVTMIEEESREFSETITSMTTKQASNGTAYENVYYNLSTADNTKEILSMAAVRFGQELSQEHTQEEIENGECTNLKNITSNGNNNTKTCAGHREETENYIKNLYHASHLLYTTESAPYDCGNTTTCTRKEKKTDSKYVKVQFSKLTGKELLELDLSGYIDVHYDQAGNPIYGYKKQNVTTYHCPGTHVDVTVTSSVLKFNDIFASDDISYSGLGDVAFSFESESNPWMCVDDSALQDGSGYNYGLSSMTYSSGSIQNFMQYLSSYDRDLYQAFAGLSPGTKAFNDKWTSNDWSTEETKRMINAQRSFVWMQYGSAAVNKCMNETGVDLSRSKALKEVAVSRGLNNPTTDWYSGAKLTSDMSDEEIITAMYDHIYENIETFWPGQPQNHAGLRNRMIKEKALLLSLCGTNTEDASNNTTWEGWNEDTIEWAKSIYEQDWDEIYTGYKETYLNWGGSGIAIEIKEKEFAKILEVLDSKIGSPYVWGAIGPNTFDCSGLVKYVYETAGVYDFKGARPTTRTLYAQCIPIPSTEAKQGDLVLWDIPGRIHHVGIYCGNGIVCHAPQTGDVVKYSKLWGNYGFFRLPEQ